MSSRNSKSLVLAIVASAVLAGCPKKQPAEEVPVEAPVPTEEAVVPAAPAEGSAAPATAVAPKPEEQDGPRVERRVDTTASRELAAKLGLAPPAPLLVGDLLTRADVREVTAFAGELMETSLEGIEPSPEYNTIRLSADGGYGFALQVWQLTDVRQLSTRFRRLRETYFQSALDPASVANEAFTADFQGFRHYAFMHRASKSIAVVTCDMALCSPEHVRELAQRVVNRL
jgi:hypothetical protein